MRPVTQTRFGYPEGNCFMACMASLMECELEDLPDLFEECCEWDGDEARWKEDDHRWWNIAYQAALSRGFYLAYLPSGVGAPRGYSIAGGDSPRSDVVNEDGENVGHAVVVCDGVLAHDPHPSGKGIDGDPEEFFVLVPLAESYAP